MKRNSNKGLILFFIVVLALMVLATYSVYYWYLTHTAYIFPPINKSDLNSFAQLGSYFGGFLSPILGAISTILIMGSILYQANAAQENLLKLSQQITQDRNESLRSQLIELFDDAVKKQNDILDEKFEITVPAEESDGFLGSVLKQGTYSLRRLIDFLDVTEIPDDPQYLGKSPADLLNEAFRSFDPTVGETYFTWIWINLRRAELNMREIHSISKDLLQVIDLKTIQDIWVGRHYDSIQLCRDVGVTDEQQHAKLIDEIIKVRAVKCCD